MSEQASERDPVKREWTEDEWRAAYIARFVAVGVGEEFGTATYEAGEGMHDFTEDPQQAADDEMSYWDDDDGPTE